MENKREGNIYDKIVKENIEIELINLKTAMDSIAEYIKEERDVLYLRGQEREQIKVIKNLLTESDFSLDKIAMVVGVLVDFVKSVQRQITDK
jgi:hypothetical protein